jgi:hypothetical protein
LAEKQSLKHQLQTQASKLVDLKVPAPRRMIRSAATAAENLLQMLPGNHIDDDAFGFAPRPTTGVMVSHRGMYQRIERQPQSSGGIHRLVPFEYQDSLQQKGLNTTYHP